MLRDICRKGSLDALRNKSYGIYEHSNHIKSDRIFPCYFTKAKSFPQYQISTETFVAVHADLCYEMAQGRNEQAPNKSEPTRRSDILSQVDSRIEDGRSLPDLPGCEVDKCARKIK